MSENIPPTQQSGQILFLETLTSRLDRIEASIDVLKEMLLAVVAKTLSDPHSEILKLRAAFEVDVDSRLRNRQQEYATRPGAAELAEFLKRIKEERES